MNKSKSKYIKQPVKTVRIYISGFNKVISENSLQIDLNKVVENINLKT